MKVIADIHTHSLASAHAFSTITENALQAEKMGLEVMALTDHAPEMPDAPHLWHFASMKSILPKYIHDVRILSGCELNIMDYEGTVDLPKKIIENLDVVIASCHGPMLLGGTINEHTHMWKKIAENPLIDVIGHPGNPTYEFDFETGIKEFKKHNKIVEINSHSINARPGSERNCIAIAKLCKEYKVPVVVNSDAHYSANVGEVTWSMNLLKSINFPEKLILSIDKKRLFKHLNIKQ